jgi:branched-chain amino acid transport system ATP-binding protein
MTAVLDVKNISIAFGGLKAVQDFSLAIPPRGLYGLIGPNGAGKTTCFNLLTGVYKPNTGDVTLSGKRINGLKPYQIAAAGLSRTFQNIRLFGELTVLDNVKLACHLRGGHSIFSTILRTAGFVGQERAIEEQAMEMLRIFGLDTRAGEQARNLPYGDQRRLEIARALATEPRDRSHPVPPPNHSRCSCLRRHLRPPRAEVAACVRRLQRVRLQRRAAHGRRSQRCLPKRARC